MDPAVFSLLAVGLHHADEIPAGAADQPWLAIVERADGWHLEAAKVQVVPDPKSSQRAVTVPDLGATPALLVRGPGLVPGPLKVAAEEPRPLYPGDRQTLTLGPGPAIEIQSSGVAAANRFGRIEVQRYGLTATVEGRTTSLLPEAPLQKRGDVPAVLFAADLDRDGKLDLVVDTSTHYNVVERRLLLSSPADQGEPLADVAQVRQLGG